MLAESSPAERNVPIGTSAIMCALTESRIANVLNSIALSEDIRSASSQALLIASFIFQYWCIFCSPKMSISRIWPAGSIWIFS